MKYKCPKCGEDFSSAVFGYFIPDEAVVSRFNELWKSQKVECCAHSDCHLDWFYRLRPTPRYRPFTAVEAAGHLGKKVTIKRSDSCYIEWRISAAGLMFENNGAYTWQEAVDQIIFTDTGEPFGVKEE